MKKASDDIIRFMEGAIGVVEATSGEYSWLYERMKGKRTWREELSGYGEEVGKLDGRPVCISLRVAFVDDHKIIFIHDTSTVVDHDMIRAWLDKNAPFTAFNDRKLNMTDSTNFHNVFHYINNREFYAEKVAAEA